MIHREHRHRQRQVLEHCSFKSLGNEEPGTRKVKKVSYRSNQVDMSKVEQWSAALDILMNMKMDS